MNRKYDVMAAIGYYRVFAWDRERLDEHIIGRDGKCNCGGRYAESARCEHIRAVIEHLKSGGARCADAPDHHELQPPIPTECPICGKVVHLHRVHRAREVFWKCEADPAHFWEHRGNGKVKAFLLDRKHFNKLGPFYKKEITDAEKKPTRSIPTLD